ncbi:MAG: sensor histidine kinase N-terminal domain-containing protein [Burkholderiales bacterium]|nr:sensor histidine kinase N-terminal domain-containing protein [Burkholderiales bacterium]
MAEADPSSPWRLRSWRAQVFGAPTEFNSLFGEILDWMLAPLLFLWPISIAVTHHVANQIADQPYDQALAENVGAIVRLVRISESRVHVDFPAPARALLRADEQDALFFQVTGLQGELVVGDREIPWVEIPEKPEPGQVLFRDDDVSGEDIRVAYQFLPVPAGKVPVLVQVAETRKKREALASRIISGVLLPQFAIIPLAVVLVYLGLSRGIAPLNRLQERIRLRRPGDLSPIGIHGVPDEMRPVVVAFNEMMARLEQNLQAQQRFIADAAHQMRTPLTGLKTQTELALGETDPDQMSRSLRQIAESADRAAHLINQLLVLARAEASHEKVHAVEYLDLLRLARRVTQDCLPLALAKGIDLGLEADEVPVHLQGVPLLLGEMLANLIDNAVKYTPRGGSVTVRLRDGATGIRLEVEDTGCGIPEADRERVFERFYRVLGVEADGSGLGLPIVREIADLHRGVVWLEAGPGGKGTRAVVTFPRESSSKSPETVEP